MLESVIKLPEAPLDFRAHSLDTLQQVVHLGWRKFVSENRLYKFQGHGIIG